MLFKPGTYAVFNASSGLALTFCPTNPPSIGCGAFDPKGHPHQQWVFTHIDPDNSHYTIKSMVGPTPIYLTVASHLKDSAAVALGPTPLSWRVEAQSDRGAKITFPTSDLSVGCNSSVLDSGYDQVLLLAGEIVRNSKHAGPDGPNIKQILWACSRYASI
ncbi:hypothetical protein C8Q78DRAFT_757248 [Trametes maxima]|nr:hypothetical protein C8Q78DRAFT_757248 [Trametes maxima]